MGNVPGNLLVFIYVLIEGVLLLFGVFTLAAGKFGCDECDKFDECAKPSKLKFYVQNTQSSKHSESHTSHPVLVLKSKILVLVMSILVTKCVSVAKTK